MLKNDSKYKFTKQKNKTRNPSYFMRMWKENISIIPSMKKM